MSQAQPQKVLEKCLRAVWLRARRKHDFAALLAILSWGIPLFLAGMAIDRLADLPTAGRIVVLAILLAVSFFKAWQSGWRFLRPFNATHTALVAEKRLGGLDSLLVSAVQLASTKTASGASAGLLEVTRSKAESMAMGIQPSRVVDFASLAKPLRVAMAFAAVAGVFAAVNGPLLTAGFLRIFNPWSNTAYPTKTRLDLGVGELVVKEGALARIGARVSGVVPDEAMLFLRTGKGKPHKMVLPVGGGRCEYTIASASRDFSYRIKAGDARSQWQHVRVIPAPRILDVQLGLEYPGYIGREPEEAEALTLTVPQDTKLQWRLTLDRPLRSAVLNRDGKDPMPLQLGNDGLEVVLEDVGDASRGYRFTWVEKGHGFEFVSPRYYLQVASDQAPRVELVSPEKNLVAMLGRPLEITARIQDDHGVGEAAVVYRVNQREETAVGFKFPGGEGAQPVAWDYRGTLPDLKIGDTLSFVLEARDRYPGENGPHVVRSETRRITFLSKEDYLAQVQKKRDLLLSRVQAAYRQQRAAFESVASLDPKTEGYLQACQVEAIRQELVKEQLRAIAQNLQDLLDDLAANQVSDAPEGESLEKIRGALVKIANTHLADAANRLRHQSGVASGDTNEAPDPSSAASAVNAAARDLGSLVLLRSIDSAQEVFARETRMLAMVQASLRLRTEIREGTDGSLYMEQVEVAQWTERLIAELQNGTSYGKRPLAVLRLLRSLKDLQDSKVADRMKEAAKLTQQRYTEHHARIQAELVTILLDAGFSVRLSGAYPMLLKTRDQLRSIAKSQELFRERCLEMTDQEANERSLSVAADQRLLRKPLLTMPLQSVPAPRVQIFDETLPAPPPVLDLLLEADKAMGKAATLLKVGQKEDAVESQHDARQALESLAGLLDQSSVELGLQTLGLGTLVAASGERLSRIEEYEAQVVALLEKTDIAASEGQKVDGLVGPQLLLAEELAAFNQDLVKRNQSEPDQDIPPLLGRMERVERALREAATALEANKADDAVARQEQAADILAEAFGVVTNQNEQLGLLQSLLMFQRSVGFANGYMADIVAQQKDLARATKALESDEVSPVLNHLGNLRRCLDDVAPLLDLVASRVDAGSPLAFAKADLEDAVSSLKAGDKLDSLDAQEVAAESLGEVQKLVKAVRAQAGYVSEIVEFLHKSASGLSILEYQQAALASEAGATKPDALGVLVVRQREMAEKAGELGKQLEEVTGMPDFGEPSKAMEEALAALGSKDAGAASEQMELAVGLIVENAESIFAVVRMLHGLPDIDIQLHPESDAVQRLVDVLEVATDHKMLFRQANGAGETKALASQESELAARCEELAKAGETHKLLNAATTQLQEASKALESGDQDAAKGSQKAALRSLRHFIIEQALVLETAKPPSVSSEGDETDAGEGSDSESAFAAGFIADFVSGEAPKDKRSGWNVRGDRDRAALNQNFARELPLEYRGLLKNYYERVAE